MESQPRIRRRILTRFAAAAEPISHAAVPYEFSDIDPQLLASHIRRLRDDGLLEELTPPALNQPFGLLRITPLGCEFLERRRRDVRNWTAAIATLIALSAVGSVIKQLVRQLWAG